MNGATKCLVGLATVLILCEPIFVPGPQAKGAADVTRSEVLVDALPAAVMKAALTQVDSDRIQAGFVVTADARTTYEVICRRDDGQPLTINVSADGRELSWFLDPGGEIPAEADAGDEESERQVSLEQVPPAARAAILAEARDHQVLEVDEVTLKGRVLYAAEWVHGAQEIEVTVTADGEVIGREIEAADDEEDEVEHEDESEKGGRDD